MLPQWEGQAGFSKFSGFCNIVGSISRYSTFNFAFAYIYKREDPRTDKPMDFIRKVEDEVIMDALSHKLDRPLINL